MQEKNKEKQAVGIDYFQNNPKRYE